MHKSYLITFFFSFLIISTFTYSQNLNFQHFTKKEGLSSESVRAILQDNYGFLWIATDVGLNRFDGYNFKIYGKESPSNCGLKSNKITALMEDSSNHLWVGTDNGGVYRYIRKNDYFESLGQIIDSHNHLTDQSINLFYQDSTGIWICTDYGLYRINYEKKKVTRFLNPKPDQNMFSSICPAENGNYWIGIKNGGLYKFDPKTNRFTPIYKNISVTKILLDSPNSIWIGTEAKGLFYYNIKKNSFKSYTHNLQNSYSISGNHIMDIFKDRTNKLWIATYNGLNKFNFKTQKFISYKHKFGQTSSISNNIVNTIYEDREGSLWLGCLGGLDKTNLSRNQFKNYLNHKAIGSKIVVGCFLEDSKGNLWVGTLGNGIYIYDKNMKLLRHLLYNPQNSNGINSNMIIHLYQDSERIIWISTNNNGLDRYDPYTKKFSIFKQISLHVSGSFNFITDVYEDKNKNLWIGTYYRGMLKFNKKTKTITHYQHNPSKPHSLINNYINGFLKDESGNFWVATRKGLDKFSPETGKFTEFTQSSKSGPGLDGKEILTMYVDSKHNFWVGTYGSGLYKVNRKTGNCIVYTKKDGLSSNEIYGILEDGTGNLWLSTNYGITKFNPYTKKTARYSTVDGLPANEFAQAAHFINSKGEFFFGGVNGFTMFNPNDFHKNNVIPKVAITGLRIFNKNISLSDTAVVKYFWSANPEIQLNYDQNIFSFIFTSLSFANPAKNKFAYRMEGYNSKWIYTNSDNRIATFTNLHPGKYTFHIIGSNNDGIWNRKGIKISVIIMPPWWETWWAYTLYLILFVGIIFSVIKYQVYRARRIEKAKSEEREAIRREMAADFHDGSGDKLAQLIMLSKFLQSSIKSQSKEITNSVNWIVDASERLKNETEDFLWTLDAEVNTLYDLCIKLKNHGFKLFSQNQKQVNFNVKGITDLFKEIKLNMDWKRNILFIFKEAMSNSFKYSLCSNISFEFELKDSAIIIKYFDDGNGFDEETLTRKSGLKNMRNRASKLGGNISIFSKKGNGVKIIFTGSLPK